MSRHPGGPARGPVRVIDSHTAGEPTRVVIEGGPDLGTGPLEQRAARLDGAHAGFRRATIMEPRGHDAVVGALLVEPHSEGADVGVVFYNDEGALGMCGHGAIGLVATLRYMGRLAPGAPCRIETPAGIVTATSDAAGRVSIRNVESYRLRRDVAIEVPGYGEVTGDVAWGGNWFFLARWAPRGTRLSPGFTPELTRATLAIRAALTRSGVTGADGAEIDHVELFQPPADASNDSRNFVLCPGGAYDRSPCGTGTSAKLACLFEDGELGEGEIWRQESVIGTVFEASCSPAGRGVVPTITSSAFVTGETTLLFDPRDPLAEGLPVTSA